MRITEEITNKKNVYFWGKTMIEGTDRSPWGRNTIIYILSLNPALPPGSIKLHFNFTKLLLGKLGLWSHRKLAVL